MAKLNQELVKRIEDILGERPWMNPVLLAQMLVDEGFLNFHIVDALNDAGIEAAEIRLADQKLKTALPNGKKIPIGFLVGGYACLRSELQDVLSELSQMDRERYEPTCIQHWADAGNWQLGTDLPNAFTLIISRGLNIPAPMEHIIGLALEKAVTELEIDFPQDVSGFTLEQLGELVPA